MIDKSVPVINHKLVSKEFIEPSYNYTYDVIPLGEYADQTIGKIRKLSLLIGEIHEIQLKRDTHSPPIFTIAYDNIDEVEMIEYDRGIKELLKLRDNKALSISVVDSEDLPYVEPSFTKSLGHKVGICILLYISSVSGNQIIDLLQRLKKWGMIKKPSSNYWHFCREHLYVISVDSIRSLCTFLMNIFVFHVLGGNTDK